MKRLLDTNAIQYLLGGKLARPLEPAQYFVSIISEMELLSSPSLDASATGNVKAFLSAITLVQLTPEIKELAINLRRQHSLKLPDAIIAATAMHLNAQLLTNDTKLLKIPGLSCQPVKLA